MKIHEYQAKQIMGAYDIPVPKGSVDLAVPADAELVIEGKISTPKGRREILTLKIDVSSEESM